MKEILLTQGKKALVDDEDYDRLNLVSWHFHNAGYAARIIHTTKGRLTIFMHDEVNPPREGEENDHIDRNGLNNVRTNLRSVTKSINHLNAIIPSNNTSGFKGVTFHKKNKKWVSHVRLDGNLIYLGSFSSPEEAAQARINYLTCP